MIATEDIEDALILDIKANITGIGTVDTLEKEFSEETLKGMLLKTPFALIRWAGLKPVESERGADGSSGMKREQYALIVGAQSVRSRKSAQRGCYTIIDDLRERYDGRTPLTVDSTEIYLQLDEVQFLFCKDGLTVYGVWLGRYDN
jgi:phage gp37-like protein